MTNLCSGPNKYKHNWDSIKISIKEKKKYNIALISLIKERVNLVDTVLDKLRKRNYNYYPWDITSIDYWIYNKNGDIREGILWKSR